ncbi:MAG: hypothetical protein HDR43_02475 [Mycoplasma sp.]|nr:hypothetical protein [Mycoplasma sp.]
MIGNNNSGKSNIINVISKISHDRVSWNDFEYVKYLNGIREDEELSIELEMMYYDEKKNVPLKLIVNKVTIYNGIYKEYIDKLKKQIEVNLSRLKNTKYESSKAYISDDLKTFDREERYDKFIKRIKDSTLEEKNEILKISSDIMKVHKLILSRK